MGFWNWMFVAIEGVHILCEDSDLKRKDLLCEEAVES